MVFEILCGYKCLSGGLERYYRWFVNNNGPEICDVGALISTTVALLCATFVLGLG